MEPLGENGIGCESGTGLKDAHSPARRMAYLFIALAVMGAIVMAPGPGPLERGGEVVPLTWAGKATLGILAAAIILWITEVVPFSITALAVMVLIPVFGIDTFASVIKLGFGNPIIVFFIGVLVLSSAFTRTGLGRRLSLLIIAVMGTRTRMVILGFIIVGAMLSMWVTDMAVAAILLPIGAAILKQAGLKPLKSDFGRGLMISCAWGPLIGGIATPAGCGPNILAIGFLKQLAGVNIDFLTWMSLGLPASLLMIPTGWFIIIKMFPPEIDRLPFSREELRAVKPGEGGLGKREIWTIVIFLAVIATWLASPLVKDLSGGRVDIPMQAVALAGALFLFLPGIDVLTWQEAKQDVDWGGIILICAGISLGMVVYQTGAARWAAWLILEPVMRLPGAVRVYAIVVVVCLLHMAFSSNTVTGTIIIPLLIALANDLKINPWIICAPAAFSSSLAFILVTESPTNVIPYSAGYFTIKDMAKAGIIMTLAAALCVAVAIVVVGGITGSYDIW